MYEFKNEFKTDIEFVDSQHKRLFDIADKIYLLLNDEFSIDKYDKILDLIEELKDYTAFHFSAEEKYMESINYKDLSSQKEEHKLFIKKLDEIDFNDLDNNQDNYIKDILSFVNSWLINHIYEKDKLIPKQNI
ncbi:MAG: hemerythrin family protein [Clostridiales bacterium]|nr:hemerythrin family protein [Clostridiales bacterium]